jgi:hypothetical protein
VTIERFHEWNAKFMAEVASKRALEEQKRKAELGNKLTGKPKPLVERYAHFCLKVASSLR